MESTKDKEMIGMVMNMTLILGLVTGSYAAMLLPILQTNPFI
jgi:hypothetical protein